VLEPGATGDTAARELGGVGGALYAAVRFLAAGPRLYYVLVQRHPVAQVTPWLLLVPVLAVGWALRSGATARDRAVAGRRNGARRRADHRAARDRARLGRFPPAKPVGFKDVSSTSSRGSNIRAVGGTRAARNPGRVARRSASNTRSAAHALHRGFTQASAAAELRNHQREVEQQRRQLHQGGRGSSTARTRRTISR
jgi:hypothetical protein